MKTKRFAWCFLVTAVLLSACEKSVSEESVYLSDTSLEKQCPYIVSQEEAIEEVNNLLNIIDENSTRGVHDRRSIESVDLIHQDISPVRAESDNFSFEGIYVISFANDEGFALASADSRTTPVFCIVDKGTFSLDENISPALAVFLDNLDKALQDTLSPLYLKNVETDTVNTSSTRSTTYGDWQIVSQVNPKISTLWHEAWPYNQYFPSYPTGVVGPTPAFNGHFPTGSSTVAVGQIIAAMEITHNPPVYYNLNNYDWTAMKTPGNYTYVASFLRDIGECFFSNWGEEETTCDLGRVRDYLIDDWGCTVIKESDADSHVEDAVSFLAETPLKNNLIYSRADSGRRTFLGIPIEYSGDYAWAIDGCVIRQRTKTTTNIFGHTSTSTETQRLLHCNMGYLTNAYNGYYVNTDFTAPLTSPTSNAIVLESQNLIYRNKFLYISK